MSLGKKTINLIKQVLRDPKKRDLYTTQELAYMEIQLERMKATRKLRKQQRKSAKGLGNE